MPQWVNKPKTKSTCYSLSPLVISAEAWPRHHVCNVCCCVCLQALSNPVLLLHVVLVIGLVVVLSLPGHSPWNRRCTCAGLLLLRQLQDVLDVLSRGLASGASMTNRWNLVLEDDVSDVEG